MIKRKILIIAAHPDDEILGCGGLIAKELRRGSEISLLILSIGCDLKNKKLIKKKKEYFSKVCSFFKIKKTKLLNFKDGLFDSYPIAKLVGAIEDQVAMFAPNIIYTHSNFDLNQDHRKTHEATMIACRYMRNGLVEKIYSYEVLSTSEQAFIPTQSFVPTVFEEIGELDLEAKVKALSFYESEIQKYPHPRSGEAVRYLAKIRGVAAGVNLAESFMLLREVNH